MSYLRKLLFTRKNINLIGLSGLNYSISKGYFHHVPAYKMFILEFSEGTATVKYEVGRGFIHLTDTDVPEVFRGKGVGSAIAKEVFDFCAANGVKVQVSCSFLTEFLERNPQYLHLLDED